MEPRGSMLHSQGLSNNPYPEPNQPNYRIDTYLFKVHSILSSHLRLGLPKCKTPHENGSMNRNKNEIALTDETT